MPRILITEPIAQEGIDLLHYELPEAQIEVRLDLSSEQLLAIIGNYTVLILRSQTRVTDELLANASQRQITLASDSSETYVGKIGQPQDFTGEAGCHAFDFSRMGPEGVLSVGNEVWAGNGNSQVEVFSLISHQRLFTIDTHGVNRADEMAVGEGLLAVTNPDEPHTPFLSFIDLKTHTIVKHLPFPQATAGLEQPAWFGGKWYLSVPATRRNPGGEVDVIDPETWSVTPMAVPQCTPAGLVITRRGEAAVGCASGPQALLDVRTGKIIARVPVSSVDVVASLGDHFFFASYGSAPGQQPVQHPQLVAADCHGHLLARVFTTPVSHTVTVNPTNGHILVPLDGGEAQSWSCKRCTDGK